MGPVLQAVEEGHFLRSPAEKDQPTLCRADDQPWPCPTIRTARVRQRDYAENLRLSRLISAETRRIYV